jgi:hypothetical protein
MAMTQANRSANVSGQSSPRKRRPRDVIEWRPRQAREAKTTSELSDRSPCIGMSAGLSPAALDRGFWKRVRGDEAQPRICAGVELHRAC